MAAGLAMPAGAQLMGLPVPGGTQPSVPVDVVKILSFACSYCLTSEQFDRAIATAVNATGGRFVRAPIPVGEGQSGWREKAYFAARDLDAELGEAVKQSIYRAVQEADVTLNDPTQLYYWFLQDIPKYESRFNVLFERAKGKEATAALARAVRLVESSGAQLLPTYVLLSNGRILATLDTNSGKSPALTTLRDEVITRIEQSSKPPKS